MDTSTTLAPTVTEAPGGPGPTLRACAGCVQCRRDPDRGHGRSAGGRSSLEVAWGPPAGGAAGGAAGPPAALASAVAHWQT